MLRLGSMKIEAPGLVVEIPLPSPHRFNGNREVVPPGASIIEAGDTRYEALLGAYKMGAETLLLTLLGLEHSQFGPSIMKAVYEQWRARADLAPGLKPPKSMLPADLPGVSLDWSTVGSGLSLHCPRCGKLNVVASDAAYFNCKGCGNGFPVVSAGEPDFTFTLPYTEVPRHAVSNFMMLFGKRAGEVAQEKGFIPQGTEIPHMTRFAVLANDANQGTMTVGVWLPASFKEATKGTP